MIIDLVKSYIQMFNVKSKKHYTQLWQGIENVSSSIFTTVTITQDCLGKESKKEKYDE